MSCATDEEVEVILTGGPSDLPPAARSLRVHREAHKVKIVHRGGYEHFERDPAPESSGTGPRVYRWTTRTRIAE